MLFNTPVIPTTFYFNLEVTWSFIVVYIWFLLPFYLLTIIFFYLLRYKKILFNSYSNLTKLDLFFEIKIQRYVYLSLLSTIFLFYFIYVSPNTSIFFSHIVFSNSSYKLLLTELLTVMIFLIIYKNILNTFKDSFNNLIYVLFLFLPFSFFLLFSVKNLYSFIFTFELISILLFFFLILYLINTNSLNFLTASMTFFWLNAITSLILFSIIILFSSNFLNFEWSCIGIEHLFYKNNLIFTSLLWIFLFFKLALPPLHLWKIYSFAKIPSMYLFLYLISYFLLLFIFIIKYVYLFMFFITNYFLISLMHTIFYLNFIWITLHAFSLSSQLKWGTFIALSSILTSLVLFIIIFLIKTDLSNNNNLMQNNTMPLIYSYIVIYIYLNYLLIFVFSSANLIYFNNEFISNINLALKVNNLISKTTLKLTTMSYFIIVAGLPPTVLFFLKLHIISLFNFNLFFLIILWILIFFIVLYFYYINIKFILIKNFYNLTKEYSKNITKTIFLTSSVKYFNKSNSTNIIQNVNLNLTTLFNFLTLLLLYFSIFGFFIYTDFFILVNQLV